MSISDEITALGKIDCFSQLDAKKLKLLAFMSELVHFSAGWTIIRQGDKGEAVYVLIDGLIEASIDANGKPVYRREFGPQTFFGEIAVIKRTVRAATVTAKTDVLVLKIAAETLYRMIEDEPELGMRIAEHIERAGYTQA
jgi:CRP-like cAMP-binding protein